jgi:hypothetical protein
MVVVASPAVPPQDIPKVIAPSVQLLVVVVEYVQAVPLPDIVVVALPATLEI